MPSYKFDVARYSDMLGAFEPVKLRSGEQVQLAYMAERGKPPFMYHYVVEFDQGNAFTFDVRALPGWLASDVDRIPKRHRAELRLAAVAAKIQTSYETREALLLALLAA